MAIGMRMFKVFSMVLICLALLGCDKELELKLENLARASKLKEALLSRKVHPDVLLFCREELLVDNYFHSVFEATKSVAEKIRRKTGLNSDGAALVDEAFSFNNKIPHLALRRRLDGAIEAQKMYQGQP